MSSFQAGLVLCRIAELITEGSSSPGIRRPWDGSRSKRKEITGGVFDAGETGRTAPYSGNSASNQEFLYQDISSDASCTPTVLCRSCEMVPRGTKYIG